MKSEVMKLAWKTFRKKNDIYAFNTFAKCLKWAWHKILKKTALERNSLLKKANELYNACKNYKVKYQGVVYTVDKVTEDMELLTIKSMKLENGFYIITI